VKFYDCDDGLAISIEARDLLHVYRITDSNAYSLLDDLKCFENRRRTGHRIDGLPWNITKRVKLHGREVEVDASISDIIDYMNNHLGMITTCCCSGLVSEHPGRAVKGTIIPQISFYTEDESIAELLYQASRMTRFKDFSISPHVNYPGHVVTLSWRPRSCYLEEGSMKYARFREITPREEGMILSEFNRLKEFLEEGLN
jgi:hypothetical protein